ncbi:major facilitator superfamily domain-containing protein [Truncatella angustata]|uniref:Major facilitator superfamily domain-containing protein n=1 Tax=Truncatella angustata TaxID=152316 RepID=A0A9P9A455_9PEZI|nr:major facilitator superfamily domain-containing protein [Truncatella angustata]KAH6659569.1 major facilitator superfamily domain-containing protein [Truncatella angustata]
MSSHVYLTPGDSDSDSDFGETPNANFLHPELGEVGEAYELQERQDQTPNVDHGHDHEHDGEVDRIGDYRRRLSSSTAASFQLYTPDEEQSVVRKFDRKLVMFLSVCYMMSFLDRSNIGNARLAGMEQDLQTKPAKDEWYDWSLTSFYVAYVAFEWMSLLFKVIPAHLYVSLIIMLWGTTASLQSIATSYPVLVVLRTVLGIAEAGFSGVPFYLSFFFKKDELAFRTALFISAAPLATTFASSLAWLILKVGEASPIAPWRLLFLLEGFPSVVVGVIAWNVIPDSPQAASYLTRREKTVARLRLRHELRRAGKSASGQSSKSRLKLGEVFSVLADSKAWITAFIFFLTNMAYSSLPVFLPTILHEMGHSASQSQALSVPPYLIAFFTILITAHLSDKMQKRGPFIIAHALCSALGYTVMALARPLSISPMLRYLAVYPAASGFFNVVVLIISWTINNQATESKQGGGFALMQVIGQCGPLVGTRLYPKSDEPFFEQGMWACAGAMFGVVLLAGVLSCYLARQNKILDAEQTGRNGNAGVRAEEARGLVGNPEDGGREGDGSFRFML